MTKPATALLAAPTKAGAIVLPASGRSADMFDHIVNECMAQIGANAAGAILSGDPEYVHQMRIGLRRLTAAITLFAPLAPCPPALRAEVRWLADALGAVRDWDVLAQTTLPALERACPGEPGLAALRAAALREAAQRRRGAAAALSSARYAQLLARLRAWQRTLHAPPREAALDRFARRALRRALRRLLRRSKRLGDAARRHQVRIAAKKMRYALEFFAPLYPAGKVTRFADRMTRLQDVLGGMNDAIVAQRLLRQLTQTTPEHANDAALARGVLMGRAGAGLAQLRRRLRRFAAAPAPFRARRA